MEILKCDSCGILNYSGESSCKACGGLLVKRTATPPSAQTIKKDSTKTQGVKRNAQNTRIKVVVVLVIAFLTLPIVVLFATRSTPVLYKSETGRYPSPDSIRDGNGPLVIFNPLRSRELENKAEAYIRLVAVGEKDFDKLPYPDPSLPAFNDPLNPDALKRDREMIDGLNAQAEGHRPESWLFADRLDTKDLITLYYKVKCQDHITIGLGVVFFERKEGEWQVKQWVFFMSYPKTRLNPKLPPRRSLAPE